MGKKAAPKDIKEPRVPTRKRRTIAEVLGHLLNGNEIGLPADLPIVQVCQRIVDGFLDKDIPIHSQHQLLGLVFDRVDGKVPDKIEADIMIRGVIALPLLRASEMDWGAEAVQVLAADASARKALQASSEGPSDVVDAVEVERPPS